jgi:glycosyltransferase involved in cell wall biosynthesis
MKKYFFVLTVSFFILLIITIVWGIAILIFLSVNGIQKIFHDRGFFQTLAISPYMKWILLLDLSWIVFFVIYLFSRRNYRTEAKRHFLQYEHFTNPRICVVIPAYNEEPTIQQVVNEYRNQEFVKEVIVIDNHSSDRTVEYARDCGAKVITKNENKGFGHSLAMGLKEALKTDANIIVLTEADGTLSANDIGRMLLYIDYCDVVRGSRQVQILNEQGNLREGITHVWGNYFLAKLIQLKYINLIHFGVVNMNDIGCVLRMFKREIIEKIQDQLTYDGTDTAIGGNGFLMYLDMKCLDEGMRIIEIPVSYKKRIGMSRFRTDKKTQSLKYGWEFFKLILTY